MTSDPRNQNEGTEPQSAHLPSGKTAARIQTIANLVVIVTSLGVLWLIADRLHAPGAQQSSAYAAGDSLTHIDGVDFTGSRHTLFMAIREGCSFCERSMPFYRHLTRRLVGIPATQLRVIAISTDDPQEIGRAHV